MPKRCAKQIFCLNKILETKVMSLEISSITNVSSVRMHIGTTVSYPLQFPVCGKLIKGGLEYHISVLHDEINFDWSGIKFMYQDKPIFCLQYSLLCMKNLKLEN